MTSRAAGRSLSSAIFGPLVVAALLVATSVRAAPAVVRVFEAAVRREPSPSAPVVHVFTEESAIFVSEDVTDGSGAG